MSVELHSGDWVEAIYLVLLMHDGELAGDVSACLYRRAGVWRLEGRVRKHVDGALTLGEPGAESGDEFSEFKSPEISETLPGSADALAAAFLPSFVVPACLELGATEFDAHEKRARLDFRTEADAHRFVGLHHELAQEAGFAIRTLVIDPPGGGP